MAPETSPREWDAREYHRLSEPQFEWGRRVLDALALDPRARVLDAGCGTGRLTAHVADRVPDGTVVGVDRSINMALAAHAQLSTRANVRVVTADLVQLPFRAAFDVVFSTATFHWVLDHAALFTSLFATLAPGGRLHAQCGGGANLARAHAHAEAVMALPAFADFYREWREPWNFAEPDATARLLRAVGFADTRCWLEETPVTFPDDETYRAFMKTVVLRPHLARLPDDAVRAAFLERVAARAADDDPPFTLDYWRLNLRATKPSDARG